MKTLDEIKATVKRNYADGNDSPYTGLTDDEIGRYNGSLMFGDNGEAWPDEQEWSLVVD